jgi:hypothetical protein
MDVREREDSQVHRSSITRPWEERAALPEQSNVWYGTALPTIGSTPGQRLALPQGLNRDHSSKHQSTPAESNNPGQGIRYEGYNYGSSTGENADLNAGRPPSRSSYTLYDLNRTSLDTPRPPSQPPTKTWGSHTREPEEVAAPLNKAELCRRCSRLTTQRQGMYTY